LVRARYLVREFGDALFFAFEVSDFGGEFADLFSVVAFFVLPDPPDLVLGELFDVADP
jgi:hypothetical protein